VPQGTPRLRRVLDLFEQARALVAADPSPQAVLVREALESLPEPEGYLIAWLAATYQTAGSDAGALVEGLFIAERNAHVAEHGTQLFDNADPLGDKFLLALTNRRTRFERLVHGSDVHKAVGNMSQLLFGRITLRAFDRLPNLYLLAGPDFTYAQATRALFTHDPATPAELRAQELINPFGDGDIRMGQQQRDAVDALLLAEKGVDVNTATWDEIFNAINLLRLQTNHPYVGLRRIEMGELKELRKTISGARDADWFGTRAEGIVAFERIVRVPGVTVDNTFVGRERSPVGNTLHPYPGDTSKLEVDVETPFEVIEVKTGNETISVDDAMKYLWYTSLTSSQSDPTKPKRLTIVASTPAEVDRAREAIMAAARRLAPHIGLSGPQPVDVGIELADWSSYL